MSRRENRAEVDRTFALMDLIRNVLRQARRMEMTPPVDDDFPRVKHAFDQALLDYADCLRGMTTPKPVATAVRDADPYVKDIISHEEAEQILVRFNNSHWREKNNGETARYSIPANPSRDDDLRLHAYVRQQRMKGKLADVALQAALKTGLDYAQDATRYRWLREQAGYVEDGSSQRVQFEQDDATRSWFVQTGNRKHHGDWQSLDAAIDAAIDAGKPSGDGKEKA